MTLASILKHKGGEVVSIAPHDSLYRAAEILTARHIGAALVMDESGGMLGILSERDIVGAIARHGPQALEMQSRQVMTSPVQVAAPEMTVSAAMALMTERRFRHLPVFAEGRLRGIVSIGDVVKARIGQAEQEVDSLKAYVTGGA